MPEELSRHLAEEAAALLLRFAQLPQVSSQRYPGDFGGKIDNASIARCGGNQNQDPEGDAWTQHPVQPGRVLLEGRVQQNS